MALETKPSCARLGRPGAAVPTQRWAGETSVPTRLGRTLRRDGGHGFFVRFEFPFLGGVDAALTMEVLAEVERLLQ
jgi:hypothetical protein